MSNWIKWWKDKAFIKIWCIIIISMLLSLGIILINPDSIICIILALLMPTIGGLMIKKIISEKLDELSEK